MINKLKEKALRFEFLNQEVTKPEVIANNREWQKLMKEHSDLQDFYDMYQSYNILLKNINEAKLALESEKDAELIEMLNEDKKNNQEQLDILLEKIKLALLPKDEDDEKNVIIEIRAGAGGDEASLFGSELLRMYTRYAEKCKFKVNIINLSTTEVGGLKEGVLTISGHGVYSKFKFESGVHRVQRVPETESGGRIHTSTVTVAVLPEQNEDIDVNIDDKDLKIDICRASSAGGQCVNTTDSAVRLTHLPTGMVVTCQDERSQIQNREKALKILKSKLFDFYKAQADKEYADKRKCQVGTGDRSERIRTYNFPQGRVTDHRINLTLYNLPLVMEGDMQELVTNLQSEEQKGKLSSNAL